MSHYKPYPAYKDSEVDWFVNPPIHWQLAILSSVVHFRAGKAHEPFIEDDAEYICVNSRFISTNGLTVKRCKENITPAKKNDTLLVK